MTEQHESPRRYRSALRSQQAATTRHRVLEAAGACFARRGYAGTSLSEIGEEAGVSTETVKAQGPKRTLLLGAFEVAFAGAESDEPLAQSRSAVDLTALTGLDEFLAATAEFVAEANARTSVLWIEFLSAARADPAVEEVLAGLLERRRDDYRAVIALLIERGLRPRGDLEAAADTLSFLWSPESHQQLVLQSGWSMSAYRTQLETFAKNL